MAGSVADWIHEAMRLTGTPETWFAALMARVKLESGGNPRAINNWDSNAKAGHPSKGLMQTIDGTFNAYKLPGHGDIWNPVDNAAAAIQYIKARYGTIFRINPRTGYGEGGQVQKVPYGLYDQGGYLPTGLSISENRTGSPERVLGPRDAMPQISVNVSVFIGDTQLRGMIRQEVVLEQDKQKRRDRSMASA
jgi:SLT domain-containing protein